MNYIKLSLTTLLTASTIAMAGGDIEPVEPSVDVPEITALESISPLGLYIGVGYTYMDAEVDGTMTGNAYTLLTGYNINEYLALELRFSDTVGHMDVVGDKSIRNRADGAYKRNISNIGLYLKPQYNLIDDVNIYGLLGYGKTNIRATDVSSFQWGLGASYALVENLNLYVDYTNLTSDDIENVGTITNNTWNSQVSATTVGLSYTF